MKRIAKNSAGLNIKNPKVKANAEAEKDRTEDRSNSDEGKKPGTIEEYIKLKKLQNQILEKMLENMKHPKNKKANE